MKLPRVRFTVRRMMVVVASIALLCFLIKPLMVPATFRAAEHILNKYGTKAESSFQLRDYRAEDAVRTPSGMWKVRFVRISGTGKPQQVVMVPDQVAKRYRFNPWASLDQP